MGRSLNSESELKAQEITIKLSTLSKNYLEHLNNASNKDSTIEKKHILFELNAILNSPSKSSSIKLIEFSNTFKEANKNLLKKQRDPNWILFKKAALILLELTIVGAAVGLVDYAIRGNHSLFYAARSHGERFILEVEEISTCNV